MAILRFFLQSKAKPRKKNYKTHVIRYIFFRLIGKKLQKINNFSHSFSKIAQFWSFNHAMSYSFFYHHHTIYFSFFSYHKKLLFTYA